MVCCRNRINIKMTCKDCGKELCFSDMMAVLDQTEQVVRLMRLEN